MGGRTRSSTPFEGEEGEREPQAGAASFPQQDSGDDLGGAHGDVPGKQADGCRNADGFEWFTAVGRESQESPDLPVAGEVCRAVCPG